MNTRRPVSRLPSPGLSPQSADQAWVPFRGGELEGVRPKAQCPSCRARRASGGAPGAAGPTTAPLCFLCYRSELDRQAALKAAAVLDTASHDRFQWALPFEPVDRLRLARLKSARDTARAEQSGGLGRFDDRRRRAQIMARRAIQRIAAAVDPRCGTVVPPLEQERRFAEAMHAAELQLPESWLPFVAAR